MKHLLLLLSIFFTYLSCNQKHDEQDNYHNGIFSGGSSGERLYTIDAEDKEMNSAIKTARDNLIQFDSALKRIGIGFYRY